MATQPHVRNPIEWGWETIKETGHALGSAANSMDGAWDAHDLAPPVVRKIGIADLTLIAPLFGVGLYEMSRRRERGVAIGWADAFAVLRSPAIGSVLVLGLLLLALFALWLFAASFIYTLTLGPDLPISAANFARDVLTTPQGWTMIAVGMGVGFLFALAVLVISVVSFPLLLDRNVGVYCAVATSVKAVRENPGPMAAWGLIIAAGLVIGTIPLLVGLAIVLPILGHATWHLYRKVVVH